MNTKDLACDLTEVILLLKSLGILALFLNNFSKRLFHIRLPADLGECLFSQLLTNSDHYSF